MGAGCSKDEGKAGEAAADEPTGVVECDEYIAKMKACIEKMPEAARSSVKESLQATRETFKANMDSEQRKAELKESCKQMLQQLGLNPQCK